MKQEPAGRRHFTPDHPCGAAAFCRFFPRFDLIIHTQAPQFCTFYSQDRYRKLSSRRPPQATSHNVLRSAGRRQSFRQSATETGIPQAWRREKQKRSYNAEGRQSRRHDDRKDGDGITEKRRFIYCLLRPASHRLPSDYFRRIPRKRARMRFLMLCNFTVGFYCFRII